jgi:hypothetical protein
MNDTGQASALIDTLGGTKRVAALCGVQAPSISLWRKRGIPRSWALYLHSKYPDKFDAAGNVVTPSSAD